MKVELVDAEDPEEGEIELVAGPAADGEQHYFRDGRPGTDRWGNERAERQACGLGWDEYVCPLYAADICPGEANPGTRMVPSAQAVCELRCGECGGGGRDDTTDFCGHRRGAPMLQYAIDELGTLDLREYSAAPAASLPAFPCGFAPTVEWGVKSWGLEDLNNYWPGPGPWPMVMTTVKTAAPGNRADPSLIRDRLGGFDGIIGVNGLVKDGLLDTCWDNRRRIIDYCRASGVQLMITWQLCVPLDTEILTRAGWKPHDQVQLGEQTLGYNPASGLSEWTEITGIHRYDDAELVRFGNERWSATCTPNHRWVTERADGSIEYVPTSELGAERAEGSHVMLAAPYAGGESLLTAQEAAIIAWAHTDGHVRIGAGRWPSGPRALMVVITQKKYVEALDELLRDVPHGRYEVPSEPGLVRWALAAEYAHALWEKAGLNVDADLSGLLLRLSRPALEAFMEAAWMAEGHAAAGTRILSQKEGPMCEALKLGAYLLGRRPSDRQANANPQMRAIGLCQPQVKQRSLTSVAHGRGPVWCVETKLRSWTMREHGEVMPGAICLTGNSYY